MKYFKLTHNEKDYMPKVINWYEKINPQYLCKEKYKKIPKNVLLDMKLADDYVYTDVIIHPFLMVSKEACQVISMYDKRIPFINAILLDIRNKGQVVYYIPILEQIKSLDREEVGTQVLFRVDDQMDRNIYIRLDLVESLLKRDACGICLETAFF